MIIDHIGFALINHLPGASDPASVTSAVYMICRFLGRLAFPLYCFMLVEGAAHTRSHLKYAIRLLIFGLISEVPFDLAFYKMPIYAKHQNVFFSLFLGILMLWAFDLIKNKGIEKIPGIVFKILGLTIPTAYFGWRIGSNLNTIFGIDIPSVTAYAATAAVAFILIFVLIYNTAKKQSDTAALLLCGNLTVMCIFAFIADMARTDYRSAGILTIAAMYIYRRDRFISMISGCVILSVLSNPTELFAFCNLPIISKYNGQRGRGPKYLFYIVYPAHLLILYLISKALGIGVPGIL